MERSVRQKMFQVVHVTGKPEETKVKYNGQVRQSFPI